jgi:hypothetical protein
VSQERIGLDVGDGMLARTSYLPEIRYESAVLISCRKSAKSKQHREINARGKGRVTFLLNLISRISNAQLYIFPKIILLSPSHFHQCSSFPGRLS